MRLVRPVRPPLNFSRGIPRINWNHPLAIGLVGAYLPGVSGGVNLVGNGGTLSLQSGAAYSSGPEGPALLSASTPAGLNATAPAAFYAGNFFSFYSRNHVTANSGGSAPIIQISDSSSWSSPFVFMGVRAGASGTTAAGGLLLQYSGGGSYQQEAIGQWTAGQTNSVGCSYDMSLGTSGALTGYVNGVPHSTTLTGTKSGPSATAQVNLLTEPSGAGAIAVNAINYCSYFWVRKLSDVEQAWLDREPRAFLIYPQDVIRVGAAAAGGSFIPAWAMNSNLPVLGTGTY